MQPKWTTAERFVKEGRADAHILTTQLLAEKSGLGEQVWFLKVHLAGHLGLSSTRTFGRT